LVSYVLINNITIAFFLLNKATEAGLFHSRLTVLDFVSNNSLKEDFSALLITCLWYFLYKFIQHRFYILYFL